MSSKYNVVKQENQKYNIFMIKLEDGKRCLFWNNKNASEFGDITVIFNNDNVVNINDKQILLSFHGVTNKENLNELMIAFGTEVYKKDCLNLDITKVKFNFIVDSKDEEDIANEFISKFRLDGKITHSEKYNQLTQNLDDAISNISVNSNDNQIVKEDNDEIKKYTIHEDKIYSDNDTLSITDKKKILLSEWRKDPIKSKDIYNISREELDKMLTDAVTNNLKVNHMEDNVSNKENKFERLSNDIARKEDNKVNDELGIIKNNLTNENKYTVLEKKEERINVVKPQTFSNNISVHNDEYKVDTVTTGVDSSFWDDDNELGSLDNDLPVYYVGDSNEIYNQYGKFVGRNGVGGYQINEDNNLVSTYNNTVVGQIGDIHDMDKVKEKSKVRVYKPNRKLNYNSIDKKDSGIISLPVIIFIISLFLLVGSGIILYFMK